MSKPETILIVDDDRLAQVTFRLLLDLKGYRVLLAEDGDEALQILLHDNVDVVLLDILMPNKDGIETMIEIRRRKPGLPVLVISGGGVRKRQDLLSLALKFGASARLSKPLGSQQVLQYLDNACGQAA